MALLLKKTGLEKGIIVFTHKEWTYFESNNFFSGKISKLKNEFFLGYNSGAYQSEKLIPKLVDFSIGDDTFFKVLNDNVVKIPFYDGNFISREFYNLNLEKKYFDITSISTSSKLKRTRELLFALKKSKKKLKALIIIVTSKYDDSIFQDQQLFELKEQILSKEEKEFITVMILSPDMAPLGLNKSVLNWFLNNSKLFYAGSDYEGGNRSSKEAMLAGCKIIYYKHTRSGIPLGLDKKNSLAFDDYNKISEVINLGLANYKYLKTNKSSYLNFSSIFTLEKITPLLRKYFKDPEIASKIINYDNLSIDLPAHNIDVPWYIKGEMSADIKSQAQLEIFFNYIKGTFNKKENQIKLFQRQNSYSNKELFVQILINIRNKFRIKINEKK